MSEPEDRERLRALLPGDREWLTQRGWRDTTDDYPEIGTERVPE
jgi:hypothetical protein